LHARGPRGARTRRGRRARTLCRTPRSVGERADARLLLDEVEPAELEARIVKGRERGVRGLLGRVGETSRISSCWRSAMRLGSVFADDIMLVPRRRSLPWSDKAPNDDDNNPT
jgi:hypothetical protein